MNIQDLHQRLLDRFGAEVVLSLKADACDPWIEVSPEQIVAVCNYLRTEADLAFDMLSNLTAVDYLEPNAKLAPKFPYPEHLQVVYHLLSIQHKHRMVLKVKLPRWKLDQPGQLPEMPSVCEVWKIADWHEREAFDLVGINFIGHPNLVRILCDEAWEGHPLRKDYEMPLEFQGIRVR